MTDYQLSISVRIQSPVAHPPPDAPRAALRADGSRGYWSANRTFLGKEKKPDNYRLAICHARLGEREDALSQVHQAFQKREPDLIYLKHEPAFDWLKSDAPFQALTKSLQLP